MPVAPPLAASARSLLVAGLPTVSHPAERAAVITIKIATPHQLLANFSRAIISRPSLTSSQHPRVTPLLPCGDGIPAKSGESSVT